VKSKLRFSKMRGGKTIYQSSLKIHADVVVSKLLAVSSLLSLVVNPLTVEIFMTSASKQPTLVPQLMIEQLISFKNALKKEGNYYSAAKRKTMGD
jgi:hypothetical protein